MVDRRLVRLFVGLLSICLPGVVSGETHKYTPSKGVPTFAKRPPILSVKPGDIVETSTLWGEWYERAGGAWPGEVGPFQIEGALPEDTLVVKILKLRPNRDSAVSTHTPGFSALAVDKYTPMLNDPVVPQRFLWKIDRTKNIATLALPGSKLKSIT